VLSIRSGDVAIEELLKVSRPYERVPLARRPRRSQVKDGEAPPGHVHILKKSARY